jgi:glycosyltransferase involved in cell wall biosynthesis
MKLTIEKSAVVITPTIGKEALQRCTESVANQTYSNLTHYVIVDGAEHLGGVIGNMSNLHLQERPPKITTLPQNVGANGWYGHRVYAAMPFLVNADYVLFLDEDNWFEPDHVESLIKTIEENNYDWAHSLRQVYDKDGNFVADDNCESLGRWPIWWSVDFEEDKKQFLVDTSSYCFKREFLVQVCHHWYYGWGGDRRFYTILKKQYNHDNYGISGRPTLCYRLDDEIEKKYGNIRFFADGNEAIIKHYGDYPWK